VPELPAGAPAEPQETPLIEELASLADVTPTVAVSSAFDRVERALLRLLDDAGIPSYTAIGGRALARLAWRHQLISDHTLDAVAGMEVMRSLLADGPQDVDSRRAREYLATADAVLYALRSRPAVPQQRPAPAG
jgi:hypothetical protein